MFTMAFFASFIATFSLPLASPLGRQTSLCPWNGISNADNFTLLAVFKTDSGTREPLALGSNGLPNPSSLAWLGVFMLLFLRNDSANMPFMMMQSAESINPIIAKYFVLTDGEITAYGPDGSLVGVTNQVANNSGQLSFFRPDNGTTGHSAKAYCELFNTSPHGVEFPFTLAVNSGDGDHLSLCQSTTSDEFIVIYNAVGPYSTNSGYKPETCVDIYIHVLPVGHQ